MSDRCSSPEPPRPGSDAAPALPSTPLHCLLATRTAPASNELRLLRSSAQTPSGQRDEGAQEEHELAPVALHQQAANKRTQALAQPEVQPLEDALHSSMTALLSMAECMAS